MELRSPSPPYPPNNQLSSIGIWTLQAWLPGKVGVPAVPIDSPALPAGNKKSSPELGCFVAGPRIELGTSGL